MCILNIGPKVLFNEPESLGYSSNFGSNTSFIKHGKIGVSSSNIGPNVPINKTGENRGVSPTVVRTLLLSQLGNKSVPILLYFFSSFFFFWGGRGSEGWWTMTDLVNGKVILQILWLKGQRRWTVDREITSSNPGSNFFGFLQQTSLYSTYRLVLQQLFASVELLPCPAASSRFIWLTTISCSKFSLYLIYCHVCSKFSLYLIYYHVMQQVLAFSLYLIYCHVLQQVLALFDLLPCHAASSRVLALFDLLPCPAASSRFIWFTAMSCSKFSLYLIYYHALQQALASFDLLPCPTASSRFIWLTTMSCNKLSLHLIYCHVLKCRELHETVRTRRTWKRLRTVTISLKKARSSHLLP